MLNIEELTCLAQNSLLMVPVGFCLLVVQLPFLNVAWRNKVILSVSGTWTPFNPATVRSILGEYGCVLWSRQRLCWFFSSSLRKQLLQTIFRETNTYNYHSTLCFSIVKLNAHLKVWWTSLVVVSVSWSATVKNPWFSNSCSFFLSSCKIWTEVLTLLNYKWMPCVQNTVFKHMPCV